MPTEYWVTLDGAQVFPTTNREKAEEIARECREDYKLDAAVVEGRTWTTIDEMDPDQLLEEWRRVGEFMDKGPTGEGWPVEPHPHDADAAERASDYSEELSKQYTKLTGEDILEVHFATKDRG